MLLKRSKNSQEICEWCWRVKTTKLSVCKKVIIMVITTGRCPFNMGLSDILSATFSTMFCSFLRLLKFYAYKLFFYFYTRFWERYKITNSVRMLNLFFVDTKVISFESGANGMSWRGNTKEVLAHTKRGKLVFSTIFIVFRIAVIFCKLIIVGQKKPHWLMLSRRDIPGVS